MPARKVSPLAATRRLTRRAARRAALARFIRLLGVSLAIIAGLLFVAVVVGKLVGQSFDAIMLGVVGLAGSLVVASMLAVAGRWNEYRAALEIDHALGLNDALSSAIGLASEPRGNDAAFTRLAITDAERVAARVDAATVTPIALGLGWIAWPILGAAAVAAAFFVPELRFGRDGAGPPTPVVQHDQAAAEVRAAIDAVRESAPDDPVATANQLEALEELERELIAGKTSPDEVVQGAAEALDEHADALDQRAALDQQTDDVLADRLERLEPETLDSASALARALRQGDLESARRAVRDLSRTIDDLSPDERQALAEELERLADQLDAPDEPPGDERGLEDRGVPPEQAEEFADATDPDEIAEQLRESGMDPTDAARAAEQIADQNREREAEQRAREQAERLSESLRDAAERLDEPELPTPDQTDEQQPGEQPQQDPSQPGEQPRQDPSQPGEQPQQDPSQPGEQPQQDPSQPGEQPGEAQPGEPTDEQGEQREAVSEQEEQDQSGEPMARDGPGDPGNALERFEQQLERLEEARQRAERDRRAAQGLREQARDMLEKMSPQERREMLDRWSKLNQQRQAGAAPRVDSGTQDSSPAEPDTPSERVDMSRPS
ncbi:MAG: hypothetical protein IH985_09565, partial [Planctomycetes bacterium]|nr:hypothetical protein [Planctomycetota bacterium]